MLKNNRGHFEVNLFKVFGLIIALPVLIPIYWIKDKIKKKKKAKS